MRTRCPSCDAPVQKAGRVLFDLNPTSGRLTHSCQEALPMTTAEAPPVLRGPADADHYRVKVGRYGDRWYTDPLPACDIAPAVVEGADVWPSVSAIKNASTSDWTFVGLKRVAEALEERPDCLSDLTYDERYERLKAINKVGLKLAMDRGTNVHTYLERGLRGQSVEAFTPGEPGSEYLPAVRSFLASYKPTLVAAEMVCIDRSLHGVGYGGTGDGIIGIDGKRYIIDWKSRGADSSHGAYAEEAAQLGAYYSAEYMLVEGPDGPMRQRVPEVDGGLIVSIKPDGVRLYPIDLEKAAAHFRALHAWWIAKKDASAAIGRPLAPRAIPAQEEFDPLAVLIRNAGTPDALAALWRQWRDEWTADHTALAAARKAELAAVA